MDLQTIRSLIHTAREAWVAGKADEFANLFTSQGEFIVPGQRWVGRSEIRQAIADFSASAEDVTIVIQRILIDGETAVVEWDWADTEKASQRRNRANDAIVVDFQDGLISRWREYIDTRTPSREE